MKKKIIIASALTICLTGQALAFTDVPSTHWAYQYINQASNNGWVTGVGNNKFNPSGNVTTAEFYTLLARAFYPSEIPTTVTQGQWYSGKWYAPYYEVGLKHNFGNYALENEWNVEQPLTRLGMAKYISNVLNDKGITISDSLLNETMSKIPDMNKVLLDNYKEAVAHVYALGIITGVDSAGNFNPSGYMNRGQASAVLCRLNDVIKNGGSIDTGSNNSNGNNISSGSSNESKNYGPVGTLSDFEVTLSYETHKPVNDYWSKTDPAIQAVTDKDAYNAAVQTLADYPISVSTGIYDNLSKNPYYNYAVINDENYTQKIKMVDVATSSMSGFGEEQVVFNPARATGMYFILTDIHDFSGYDVYKDVLDSITPDMTDREVVIKCMRKLTDTFTYADGNGNWTGNPSYSGLCGNLSEAASEILNAVGIPTFLTAVPNHMYCYSLIDGEWWAVDPTIAEHNSVNSDYQPTWIMDADEAWQVHYGKGAIADINTFGKKANIIRTMIDQAKYAPRHNK